jgi:hypothetical protein
MLCHTLAAKAPGSPSCLFVGSAGGGTFDRSHWALLDMIVGHLKMLPPFQDYGLKITKLMKS